MQFQPSPRFRFLFYAVLLTVFVQARAQSSTPPPSTAITQASAALQPVLMDVTHAITSLNISHWKAPGAMRSASQQDADSIQHDLDGTLPGLIAQSNAAPASISSAFAVYRNVDALYDVLLRLAQTAALAAPRAEAGNLQYALNHLEAVRKGMGDAILAGAEDHDAQLVKLQTAIKAATVAEQRKPPTTTVVDDGPKPAHTTKRHRTRKTSTPASTGDQTQAPPKQ